MTYEEVRRDAAVKVYIAQADASMQALGFTDDQIDLLQDYSSVTVFLQERDMEMYVYSYSPAEEYRYFRLNYSLRAYDGSIGFNFNEKGLDSYELSWNS